MTSTLETNAPVVKVGYFGSEKKGLGSRDEESDTRSVL